MQAIQTKIVRPTESCSVSRIRATAPRGTMLCEVNEHYTASDERAHVIAARELAYKFAEEDRKRGDLSGYWDQKLSTGCVGGYVYAHVPTPRKRSLVIFGRRYFDRSGNTYHTAKVYVDGAYLGKSEVNYGYGDSYLSTAEAMLVAAKVLPGKGSVDALWRYCQENGIDYTFDVADVSSRKDL